MAVAGVVLLGILYAIGQWGVCCGSGLSKPLTGDSTWAKPSKPWIFGQAPTPARRADHGAKGGKGSSGGNANTAALLASIKPHGEGSRSSLPHGSSHIGDTSQPDFPLPPSAAGGGSGNRPQTDTCSPVIDVLTGLASVDCAHGAGSSDHNGSSGNHDSSGNHHSSNKGGSSENPTTLAGGPPSHGNSNGTDKGNDGSDKGKKDHGGGGKADSHGNASGNKHH
jgi:hypothetical protein